MFNKEEIDAFMDKCRIDIIDSAKEAKRILKGTNISRLDVDKVVKKAVDGAKGKDYTLPHGKPDQIRGLRKEVEDGTL